MHKTTGSKRFPLERINVKITSVRTVRRPDRWRYSGGNRCIFNINEIFQPSVTEPCHRSTSGQSPRDISLREKKYFASLAVIAAKFKESERKTDINVSHQTGVQAGRKVGETARAHAAAKFGQKEIKKIFQNGEYEVMAKKDTHYEEIKELFLLWIYQSQA
ncbi:hypothetical protein AVEN_166827-1 [Araneus ventricosus]|uniref:Uncharacterized protein n=1 Tax=Araneus ventricosus TaxID=182803 RepID=A0A4Y2UU02_ARAVE|nr:hypothetical protein AVEN_166827-1 [Araneus ventricosus]